MCGSEVGGVGEAREGVGQPDEGQAEGGCAAAVDSDRELLVGSAGHVLHRGADELL